MEKIKQRLPSLDILRGLTVASMILVNNPGSWDFVFLQLKHAPWHGCTFTDLIFPSFLWIVGFSSVLAINHRTADGMKCSSILKHILWRALIIFALGLFINAFPFGLLSAHKFSLATLRIPGVLQRIAICYVFASLIILYCRITWQLIWIVLLLMGTYLMIATIPVPGFGAGILQAQSSLHWFIDNTVLHGHTLSVAPVAGFDPEGILGSLPAIASTLFGAVTGYWVLYTKNSMHTKTIGLLLFGLSLTLLGLFINNWLPINKNLWTSSYALFTAGIVTIAYTCCYWITEVKKHQTILKPLQIYGTNATTIFITSILIMRLTLFIRIKQVGIPSSSLKSYYFKYLFLSWTNPTIASLLHAISFVLLMYIIAYILYLRKIIIKI